MLISISKLGKQVRCATLESQVYKNENDMLKDKMAKLEDDIKKLQEDNEALNEQILSKTLDLNGSVSPVNESWDWAIKEEEQWMIDEYLNSENYLLELIEEFKVGMKEMY